MEKKQVLRIKKKQARREKIVNRKKSNLRKTQEARENNKKLRTMVKNIVKSARNNGLGEDLESKFVKNAKKIFHWRKVSRLQSRLKKNIKKA